MTWIWPIILLLTGGLADTTPEVEEPVVTQNILILDVDDASLFVQPGETVTIEMKVLNLAQMVNGCQALMGYASQYWTDPRSVAPGGGLWTELIYESWTVPGELDTAIGVELGGPVGTMADGVVATITLTAGTTEGRTQLVFRPDVDPKYATFLSDLDAQPVWPAKIDSQNVVIDGTPPTVDITGADQNATELLVSLGYTTPAIQGVVNVEVTASDLLAGIGVPPELTALDSDGDPITVAFLNESPAGVFHYQVQVTSDTANGLATLQARAVDQSGNEAVADDGFYVNKNQIQGRVEFKTLSGAGYTRNRMVVLTATDGSGQVLAQWTPTLTFLNGAIPGVAGADFVLTGVPDGVVYLSAKTDWTLRKRLDVNFDADGQAWVYFTQGTGNDLPGGDLTGDNIVNLLDYGLLQSKWNSLDPSADINGDGAVQLLDYALLKGNWFTVGDPQ